MKRVTERAVSVTGDSATARVSGRSCLGRVAGGREVVEPDGAGRGVPRGGVQEEYTGQGTTTRVHRVAQSRQD